MLFRKRKRQALPPGFVEPDTQPLNADHAIHSAHLSGGDLQMSRRPVWLTRRGEARFAGFIFF
jgi:hypothetical protein